MYGYGVSYAIASLSCTIGPFLAVTAAGLRRGSMIGDASIYLAYIAGLTLVVGDPCQHRSRWLGPEYLGLPIL